MSRVERRMYRRRQGQALLRRVLLFLSAMLVLGGAASRLTRPDAVQAVPVTEPTPTPITAAFDETIETREVALPPETWFGLQTGVFSTREAAEEKAAAYTDRGAPGYVLDTEGKYRVLIACYETREDASAVRERLQEKQSVETYLYEWSMPALTLRLTGMTGQLDVAASGLTLMDQCAARLRDQSTAVDQGETTRDEIHAFLAETGEECALWLRVVKERFDAPVPPVIAEAITLTESWQTASEAIEKAAEKDLAAMSAEMKRQAMGLYHQVTQMRQTLSAAE